MENKGDQSAWFAILEHLLWSMCMDLEAVWADLLSEVDLKCVQTVWKSMYTVKSSITTG